MKVKNVIFSGFAAAILMGAVEANAAFEIASKAYVDGVVGENGTMTQSLTTLQNKIGNAAMGTTAETVTGAIGELDGKVDTLTGNAETSGSVAHAEASAAAAKSAADAAQGDVDALEAIVGSGFNSTTNTVAAALDTKVDKTSVATSISANPVDTKWASEKAVADAIAAAVYDVTGDSGSVSEQISDALGELGTHTDPQSGQPVPNTVKDVIDALQDAVAAKADADDVYTKTQTYTKEEVGNLLNAKIDKPAANTCVAGSGHCVLSVDTQGNLTWINITNPAE